MKLPLLAGIVAFCLLPSRLLAQAAQDEERRSHFGVIVNFALPSSFRDEFNILLDADRTDVRSHDFEVGFIVRGHHLGGDWGLSYIQKNYRDGSIIGDTFDSCFQGTCFTAGRLDIMQDVQLRGISIHKFAPFVTIKRRAQIGITFGGGIAQARGSAERHDFGVETSAPGVFVQRATVTQIDAKELFLDGRDTVPIWKVEVTGAALIAPGLKLRVGGGLNFTNYPAATVSVTYLIGAR